MRSFEQNKAQLAERGVRLVAISVDAPEVTEKLRNSRGYSFTFLSDQKTDVIRRYDLLHARGGINGSDISRPAEFLLDADGVVRWENLTESYKVRANPEIINRALDLLSKQNR